MTLQLLACLARVQLLAACKPRATYEIQLRVPVSLHNLEHFFTLSHTLPLHDSHLNTGLLIAKIQANLTQNKANKMVDTIQPYITIIYIQVNTETLLSKSKSMSPFIQNTITFCQILGVSILSLMFMPPLISLPFPFWSLRTTTKPTFFWSHDTSKLRLPINQGAWSKHFPYFALQFPL